MQNHHMETHPTTPTALYIHVYMYTGLNHMCIVYGILTFRYGNVYTSFLLRGESWLV